MKKLVSIILPVFNGEQFLAQSINSCLAQSYKNIELIIVNDASTDSSYSIIEGFANKDNRVRAIHNATNKKLPASLNIGHRTAQGTLMTWTSDDNVYAPNAIEEMVISIENNNADIVYSNLYHIDEHNDIKGKYIYCKTRTILLDNIIGACFLYRKEVYENLGGYDELLHGIEDYDFWLQASRKYEFSHIDKFLYYYRKHGNSLSSSIDDPLSELSNNFKDRLTQSYRKYFLIENNIVLSEIVMKLHLTQEINVREFLKQDLFNKIYDSLPLEINRKILKKQIDLRLRYNIQRFKKNQNISMLFYILINKPELLLKYEKKRSIDIILKCIRP
ncbi:glycosyltransferase [Gelidibacter salicanalis]|uniref:Glycosyltransferase n=1 Tax=Gelidibacter salicanalis TaxID=291193 RepID=A0A5C7AEI9_9FLAO|nr:glycosyltransferase [Gelidibacter salicanalis]TXE05843.1 glycosyltransferase [Gelidibacter salicanalis]